MDTITHALSGALLARATARRNDGLSMAQRTWVGATAAAFPDIDFVLLLVDPMTYLTWHRGPTHSLVLLPLWALLAAAIFYLLFRKQILFRSLFFVCATSLCIHIAGDVITAYGTGIFFPFSDLRATISTTFIIDPLFTGIILVGLLISNFRNPQFHATLAMIALCGYVGMQSYWHGQARLLAESFAQQNGFTDYQALALPQPLSPLNWKLVVVDGDTYYQAYVRLYGSSGSFPETGWIANIASNYRKPPDLHWTVMTRFGNSFHDEWMVQQAWQREELAGFRDFAVLPALLRIDKHGLQECIWFTDLRFVIGDITPPFRYGLCGQFKNDTWRMER